MEKSTKSIITNMTIGVVTVSLVGCSAVSTFVEHRNIDSQSKMSQSIFLDPIANKDKTIYVQVKNTSGQDFSLFKPDLEKDLQAKGWTIIDDVGQPHQAMVQVNLLQFGEAKNANAVWASMGSGYGSLLAGGLAGVAAGLLTNSAAIGIGTGAGVSGVSWLADKLYSNVLYSAMTDVQISIRTKDGKVTQVTNSNLSQGTQSHISQTYNQQSDWLRYRTRVASVVQKANLTAKC